MSHAYIGQVSCAVLVCTGPCLKNVLCDCCVIVGTYIVATDCTETLRALAKVSLPYQVIANIQGTQEEQSGEGHF